MRISRALIDEIVAHSRDDAPNECCGLIGGRDGEATTIYRAENEFADPRRFKIADQLKVMKGVEAAGEEVTGIYHSHTKSEAFPSQTDINLAEWWPGVLWFICSLEDSEAPVVRAFAISDGAVDEVELEVT
jgi:[CysO sulfur-carrier protein]-S-L-cysteine hydrolase